MACVASVLAVCAMTTALFAICSALVLTSAISSSFATLAASRAVSPAATASSFAVFMASAASATAAAWAASMASRPASRASAMSVRESLAASCASVFAAAMASRASVLAAATSSSRFSAASLAVLAAASASDISALACTRLSSVSFTQLGGVVGTPLMLPSSAGSIQVLKSWLFFTASPLSARISARPAPAQAVSWAVMGQVTTPFCTVTSGTYSSRSPGRMATIIKVQPCSCTSQSLQSMTTVCVSFSPCRPSFTRSSSSTGMVSYSSSGSWSAAAFTAPSRLCSTLRPRTVWMLPVLFSLSAMSLLLSDYSKTANVGGFWFSSPRRPPTARNPVRSGWLQCGSVRRARSGSHARPRA